MKTQEEPAHGVWIEFLDTHGDTVAQQVVDEWRGRPVPDRGDYIEFAATAGAPWHSGIVIARRVDRQQAADGSPRLWVRLIVRLDAAPARARIAPRRSVPFSQN